MRSCLKHILFGPQRFTLRCGKLFKLKTVHRYLHTVFIGASGRMEGPVFYHLKLTVYPQKGSLSVLLTSVARQIVQIVHLQCNPAEKFISGPTGRIRRWADNSSNNQSEHVRE